MRESFFTYDALGRKVTSRLRPKSGNTNGTDDIVNTTVYDDSARTVTHRDHYWNSTNQKQTEITYDHGGRVVRKEFPGFAGGQTGAHTFTYNTAGLLTERVDGNGHSVHYAYEPATLRLKTKWLERDTSSTELVSTMATAESRVYDDLGRPTSVKTHWYSGYSGTGALPPELVGATTAYDELNRVTSETYTYGGLSAYAKTLTSTYEADSTFRTKLDYTSFPCPNCGSPWPLYLRFGTLSGGNYIPDNLGRTDKIHLKLPHVSDTFPLATYTFEGPGKVATRAMQAQRMVESGGVYSLQQNPIDTVTTTNSYNDLGQVTAKNHAAATSTAVDYAQPVTWNTHEGQVSYVQYPHGTGSGFSSTFDHFSYDDFGRLEKAKYGTASLTPSDSTYVEYKRWTKDMVGNWEIVESSTNNGNDWSTVIDPAFNHDIYDRYTSVVNHPQTGTNTYTYDKNGFMVSDGMYIYVPDMNGRLAEIFIIVYEGESLDTSSWKEAGLELSKKISRTMATKRKVNKRAYTLKEIKGLLKKAKMKYPASKYLTKGIPERLATVSAAETTTEATLVPIAYYGYTPSGRDERILRTNFTDYTWWSYDQGVMAEEYNSSFGVAKWHFAGIEPNEHLAHLNPGEEDHVEPLVYYLQDFRNNVVRVLEYDSSGNELEVGLHVDYDVNGVSDYFDGAGNDVSADIASLITEWGYGGMEPMAEVVVPLVHMGWGVVVDLEINTELNGRNYGQQEATPQEPPQLPTPFVGPPNPCPKGRKEIDVKIHDYGINITHSTRKFALLRGGHKAKNINAALDFITGDLSACEAVYGKGCCCLKHLKFYGEGQPGELSVGRGGNYPTPGKVYQVLNQFTAKKLSILKGKFCPNGKITLFGCSVANKGRGRNNSHQGYNLLRAVAENTGVPTTSFTGLIGSNGAYDPTPIGNQLIVTVTPDGGVTAEWANIGGYGYGHKGK